MADTDDWVERLQGPGRDAALDELRALLVKGLGRAFASRNAGGSFAEDIAQDALLKILDRLDSFEGRSQFTTWAMTIATRTAISELRRRRHQDVSLDALTKGGSLQIPEGLDVEDDAGDLQERQEILTILRRLIRERLSDKQQLAMQALLSGLPVEEIASRTNSNRNAVYKLIHDARKRLREGFAAAGITAEDMQNVLV